MISPCHMCTLRCLQILDVNHLSEDSLLLFCFALFWSAHDSALCHSAALLRSVLCCSVLFSLLCSGLLVLLVCAALLLFSALFHVAQFCSLCSVLVCSCFCSVPLCCSVLLCSMLMSVWPIAVAPSTCAEFCIVSFA